jgi:hypothetical protein
MCEEYCGKVSWWLTDEFKGMKTSGIPSAKDFPCSTHQCEVRFKMALGIFFGDHVFCSKGCFDEWWKINETR